MPSVSKFYMGGPRYLPSQCATTGGHSYIAIGPKRNRSELGTCAVLLFLTVMLTGVFLHRWADAVDAPYKVRIGYPSSAVSTLPFDIAKEKNLYSKAGVDVDKLVDFSMLPSAR